MGQGGMEVGEEGDQKAVLLGCGMLIGSELFLCFRGPEDYKTKP